ncbi:ribonuclease H-like domain-containing protein [Gamsiella multidivaricata]|uniref:ribonuclease H-like domain-containing protein n=1 Tax=Gamsiella multidivaricata TaxID=101098 RepID=UPI00221E7A56|nr:ribonuclease H-like domain-containing protein [Gamsiella multidivaricata]KAI7820774.1 ribonuclease H-like domain-containing protein [Gamsiella multidivaricata]
MEILRDNFHAELPYIKEAIDECEFIALDAEFSGLHTEPNKRTQSTTLEQGYEELRKSASQFLTVQIGISTFKFDPRNGSYSAKPFNFFIFPTTLSGYSPQGRCFLTEASSLDFLAKNRFDFNKWIYHGVHYMTKADEESYRKERTRIANNDFQTIGVDPTMRAWLDDAIARITEWKANNGAFNFINIQSSNGYQRRLIYQEVRRLWPTELQAKGHGGCIQITKTNEKDLIYQKQQQHFAVQRDVENAIGFRSVIDILSACGKPIVGHNIVIDLAYILAQFVGPLPPTMEGYKEMIHRTFPTVMDTKYVSYTANALKGMAYDSSLGGLENMVGTVNFMGCPKITPHYRHQRYMSRDLAHEAGYDAYITGSILIRMLAYIVRNEPAPLPMTENRTPNKDNRPEMNPYGFKNAKKNRATVRNSASPPPQAAAAPVRPSAPKKFSYADAVHLKRDGSQDKSKTSPTSAAKQQLPMHDVEEPAKLIGGKAAQKQHTAASNGFVYEDTGHESDRSEDGYQHQFEQEVFERPFTLQHPVLRGYQNILHWGRSNHGCINLTSP